MAHSTIDRLIVNSPYEEPAQHWQYDRESRLFSLVPGRRPAGYVVASGESQAFDDPGIFVEIPLVNKVRPRVAAWRTAGYPGVSSITAAAKIRLPSLLKAQSSPTMNRGCCRSGVNSTSPASRVCHSRASA